MTLVSRIRPYLQIALALAVLCVALNAALSALTRTPILGWLPRTVTGTGYLEDSRDRVASAAQAYREGRVPGSPHLGAVIGISNVRQGIDLSVINGRAGGDWRFLGLGGAGLGIFDVARYADVLLSSDLRPDLVVVGFGLHQMVDSRPKPGSVNVGLTDYLRRGDLRNAAIVLRDSVWVYSRRQDVNLTVQAAVLDARAWLFKRFGVELPQPAGQDRSPWRNMMRSDWPEHFSAASLKEEEQFFRDLGVFELPTYQEAPKANAALIDIIERFHARGSDVVLLLMPEHSTLWRGVPADALPLLQSRLQAHFAAKTPAILDFRKAIDDDGFVDLAHLNRRGSEQFSGMMATALRELLPVRPALMAQHPVARSAND